MQTQPAFGLKELLTQVVGGITAALGERAGETQQQRFVRTQVAAHAIMTFGPRDAVEAMIAGHCVIFHEMIVDSVQRTMRGGDDQTRRANRANIVAMDRAFGNNLTRLERYRKRPADGAHAAPDVKPEDARPKDERSEPDMADRVRRHEVHAAGKQARPVLVPSTPMEDATGKGSPEPLAPAPAAANAGFASPEMIAACEANPEAMAALNAGDAEGFARAMGVKQPGEAFLAAAASRPDIFGPRTAG